MIEHQTSDTLATKEYIGMVCHELKTPLTILQALVQMLDKKIGSGNDPGINISIAKANEQIFKMGSLINSFLNTSFIETGEMCLNYECFKLNHLIGEIAEQLRCFSENHRIILDCNEVVVTHGDREKIGCVLSNLLLNAIKYSPEGKFIYVKCFQSGSTIMVRVRDEGIGIATKYMDQIFEKKFRVFDGNAGKVGGSGIGLYLSTLIVQKHGGKIWAESIAGQGSTFYFSLPLA